MLDNLSLALQISAIGMGLVFATILLLWGGIALLVRVTRDKVPAPAITAPLVLGEEQPVSVRELKRRVAATAVAVALAQRGAQPGHSFVPQAGQTISPWQAVLRAGQIEPRGRTR